MDCYRANVSGVFLDRAEEMGFDVIYLAESKNDAVCAAARFLDGRCKAFDLTPGCIKVSVHTIQAIGPKGEYQSMSGLGFFEWKYDTSPHSFAEICSSSDARKAHGRF